MPQASWKPGQYDMPDNPAPNSDFVADLVSRLQGVEDPIAHRLLRSVVSQPSSRSWQDLSDRLVEIGHPLAAKAHGVFRSLRAHRYAR
jgi:hypothetical protein